MDCMPLPSVLIIEDDPSVSREVRQRLEARGYPVIGQAATLPDAAAHIDRRRPDICLTDITNGRGTVSIDIAHAVRHEHRVPVVFMTGAEPNPHLDQARAARPSSFIRFPITDHELVMAIDLAIEHHAIEMRYRESERLYRHLVEGTIDIILQTDVRGRFTYINPAAEKLTGYSLDEIIGVYYLKFVHKDYRGRIKEILESLFSSGKPNDYVEFPLVTKHGTIIWLGQTVSLLMDHGAITGFQAVSRDITKQKELEAVKARYQKRIRYEISSLRELQAAQQPRLPRFPEYDLATLFLPVEDISGDFFDAFALTPERYQIIVCDVSGHGITSSYFGAEIRTLFRMMSSPDRTPAELIRLVNRSVIEHFRALDYFATVAVCQIDLPSGAMLYSSGGHPESLIFRAADKTCTTIGGTGPLIGIPTPRDHSDIELRLEAGDCLLMYTDGITEMADPSGALYGVDALTNELVYNARYSAQDIIFSIISKLYEFNGYNNPGDDVTAVCVKKTPRT
ncbi:MAG TPA: SpoIIE family protein phosphatase [Spirochaetota bacterium]|nr:SpoIIE family protein phosphatase [Spirochaetota bacterium]HNT09993.1 SpoIIE family protein phosphatase [Spirochaetota bacterium]